MALIKKSCPHCGQLKDVTEFGANVGRPDGLAFYCKVCFRSLARAHYRRSREAQGLEVRPREIAPLGQKWCPDCQSYLFEQEFPRNAAARDGLSSYCKLHHAKRGRRNYFERRYGLRRERVVEMLDEQGGLCLICQRELGGEGHVDHNHKTGQVRGILCFPCNAGLGQFRDDTAVLLRAVEYLRGGLAS